MSDSTSRNEPPLNTGGGSIASLPGRILLKTVVYDRCYPQYRGKRLLSQLSIWVLLASAFVLIGTHNWILAALGVAILSMALAWWWSGVQRTQLKSHLYHGCANPAVVVSTQPYLIAVFADITATPGVKFPAVKVLPAPLDLVQGRSFAVGDHIPTVSTYQGPATEGRWTDFYPIPACCATNETRALDRLENTLHYEEEGWSALENALIHVPRPYAPGLYPMPVSVFLKNHSAA
ncbi:MAG: DUF3239 domain-containing protein [Capsulimonas sp.]|uniref:DUF3239 domain-containing protein n=1 Tax=Capsulimonas sp. TaxID=2494211 RepID=UPI0032654D87